MNSFEIKMISPESRDNFKNLLMPNVYKAMTSDVPVTAIGLIKDSRPAGAIAGMIEQGGIFSVMSFYVHPSYRRRGGGRMLIEALQTLLEKNNVPIAVLSYVEGEGESDSIGQFMEAMEIIEDIGAERIYLGSFGSYIDYGFGHKTPDMTDIRCVSDLNEDEKHRLHELMHQSEDGVKGGGISVLKTEKELSFTIMKNGQVDGFLVSGYTKKHPEDLTVLLSDSLDEAQLMKLIDILIRVLGSKTDRNKKIRIPVSDDKYEYFFEVMDGVRDIQHDYLL